MAKLSLVDPLTRKVVLGPLELLAELDGALRALEGKAAEMDFAYPARDTTGATPTYTMATSENWVRMLRRLAVTGKNPATLVPCSILVGTNRDLVVIGGDPTSVWSERAEFQMTGIAKRDLNYEKVANGFAQYCSGSTDRSIAMQMLKMLMGTDIARAGTASPKDVQRDVFLAGMVALLFGVEASRFPSSFVTSHLLLDLIIGQRTYGRDGTKRFTLKNAFHSTEWDDGEWYGGKYPYAVHGTGSGNMVRRSEMAGGATALEANFLHLTQRHAVPRREVSLLIHWLEARVAPDLIAGLTEAGAVRDYLVSRLQWTFVQKEIPALPTTHTASRDTGPHSTNRELLVEATRSGVVFWYAGGFYYHYDVGCKLFPIHAAHYDLYLAEYDVPPSLLEKYAAEPDALEDWERRKASNFFDAKSKVEKRGGLVKSSVRDAGRARKRVCPKCGAHEAPFLEEERLAAVAKEKQRVRDEKLLARQEKAKKDPVVAWELKFEAVYNPFIESKIVPTLEAVQNLREACPTKILGQYQKRLGTMTDAARQKK